MCAVGSEPTILDQHLNYFLLHNEDVATWIVNKAQGTQGSVSPTATTPSTTQSTTTILSRHDDQTTAPSQYTTSVKAKSVIAPFIETPPATFSSQPSTFATNTMELQPAKSTGHQTVASVQHIVLIALGAVATLMH